MIHRTQSSTLFPYTTLFRSSVKKTNRAIVFEEDWRSFGVGAEIVARVQEEAFDDLDAPVKRVASIEVPLPYSKPLEQARSEEHTSELQSPMYLVCRLLLEKK